jgi:Holliday junction resolvasome RuvABC DNA-binding subunit
MIDSINVARVFPGQGNLIAQTGSFNLAIEMSEKDIEYFLTFADYIKQASTLEIFIQVELKETTVQLIGFANKERRELYKALKNVPGIGSKSGLIILDCGEVIDILRAVSGKDFQFLREVPGVGQKRIEAIFKELEKKYQKALPKKLPIAVSTWVESRSAIINRKTSFSDAEIILFKTIDQLSESELKDIDPETLYLKAIKNLKKDPFI